MVPREVLWCCRRRRGRRLWGRCPATGCVMCRALGLHPGFTGPSLSTSSWAECVGWLFQLQNAKVFMCPGSEFPENLPAVFVATHYENGEVPQGLFTVCGYLWNSAPWVGRRERGHPLEEGWGMVTVSVFLGTKSASSLLGLLGTSKCQAGWQVALEGGWALQPLTSEPPPVAWGERWFLRGFASSIPGVQYTPHKVLPHLPEPYDIHNWREMQKVWGFTEQVATLSYVILWCCD